MFSQQQTCMSRVRKKQIEKSSKNFIDNLDLSVLHFLKEFDFLEKFTKMSSQPTIPALLDSLVDSYDLMYDIFCYSLLMTGQYKLFELLESEADVKKIEDYANQLARKNPLFEYTNNSNYLKTYDLGENCKPMSQKRQKILEHNIGILKLQLVLDPILKYLACYNILIEEQLMFIKGAMNRDIAINLLVEYLKCTPEIVYERFCHALLISCQFRLYLFFRDSVDLDRLEHMAERHMSLIKDFHENRENQCSQYIVEENFIQSQKISQIEENMFDDETPEPSGLLSELSIDLCDVLTASQLDYYKENKNNIYRNFSSPKGMAMIINNREFVGGHKTRVGSEVDEENLRKLLEGLGYRVQRTYKNLAANSMKSCLLSFGRHEDHRYYDSCVVAVLTHGEYEELIGADDGRLSIHEFLSCLNAKNSPLLAGKPKIFVIQACRGSNFDRGVVRHVPIDEPESLDREDTGSFTNWLSCVFPGKSIYTEHQLRAQNLSIANSNSTHFSVFLSNSTSSATSQATTRFRVVKEPTDADMLIAFATTPLYVSWRNSMAGSWFIQSICEIFSKYAAAEDILTMLTRVNQRVAQVYQSSQGGEKQIPEFATRFQKKFYFFPGVTSE